MSALYPSSVYSALENQQEPAGGFGIHWALTIFLRAKVCCAHNLTFTGVLRNLPGGGAKKIQVHRVNHIQGCPLKTPDS